MESAHGTGPSILALNACSLDTASNNGHQIGVIPEKGCSFTVNRCGYHTYHWFKVDDHHPAAPLCVELWPPAVSSACSRHYSFTLMGMQAI
ncbi:hypothetical protein ACOMHN_057851 [Nucella lapillus]